MRSPPTGAVGCPLLSPCDMLMPRMWRIRRGEGGEDGKGGVSGAEGRNGADKADQGGGDPQQKTK